MLADVKTTEMLLHNVPFPSLPHLRKQKNAERLKHTFLAFLITSFYQQHMNERKIKFTYEKCFC